MGSRERLHPQGAKAKAHPGAQLDDPDGPEEPRGGERHIRVLHVARAVRDALPGGCGGRGEARGELAVEAEEEVLVAEELGALPQERRAGKLRGRGKDDVELCAGVR